MNTTTASAVATPAFARKLYAHWTFFGVPEVSKAFGLTLDPATIPVIPFTEEELARSRELGQFLILHTPITMQQLHDQSDNKLGRGKLFYDVDWYPQEPFYTSESTGLEWLLVSRDLIPGSTGRNYLEQTQVIADYVRKQVYADMEMPAAYQAAITELKSQKAALEKLRKSNWQKAAEALASLKLNRLFRGTPAQTLYNSVAYFKTNREYLLPGKYHWSALRSARGFLVYLGGGYPDGVRVHGYVPGVSFDGLGVVFSRSVATDLVP